MPGDDRIIDDAAILKLAAEYLHFALTTKIVDDASVGDVEDRIRKTDLALRIWQTGMQNRET